MALLGMIYTVWVMVICWLGSVNLCLSTGENWGDFEVISAENGPPGVIWVVQLSDLHVSVYHPSRANSLENIVGKVLAMIKPSLVLITGDLTDAKNRDLAVTRQYEDEWIQYRQTFQTIMKESGLAANSFFDIRGNHDRFGVPYTGSKLDYFSMYSLSAYLNRTSLVKSVSVVANGGSKHLFVGVDWSMDVGLRGPCNLFGHPSDEILSSMDLALGQGNQSPDHVTKIVYGHYPLSFTASSQTGNRPEDVFAKHGVSTYICGHLHTKFGKHLYKHHKMERFENGDFWEWEMGDWRKSRMMRVLAVDHGQGSFVDISLESYDTSDSLNQIILPTIILPTFPLDSRSMQRLTPFDHLKPSNFLEVHDSVRALVFSPEDLVSVSAKIYDSLTGKMVLVDELFMHRLPGSSSSLYLAKWNPKKFSDSSPTRFWLQVCANNTAGEKIASDLRPFSVDGKLGAPIRDGIVRFLVMDIVWDFVYFDLFWGIILLISAVLVIPKLHSAYLEKLGQRNTWGVELFVSRNNNSPFQFFHFIRITWWVLIEGSKNSFVWWPEVVYLVYLVSCPWIGGLVISESHPPGYMSFRGWTVRDLPVSNLSGLGVPDVMIIVLPFLYFVLLPATCLNAALSAERSVRELHASLKFKCCKRKEENGYMNLRNNKTADPREHPAFATVANDTDNTRNSSHRIKALPCKICKGWLRKLLLGCWLVIGLFHLRQSISLMKSYGARYVLSSPGYVWPVPLIFIVGAFTTSHTKSLQGALGDLD